MLDRGKLRQTMGTITGETKLFGLLSHGASFTLSPAMHNHAARVLHKDFVYVNFDVQPGRVSEFLDLFWHIGGLGLNVTMPHKTQVASLVRCNGLTSVNTITRDADEWKGHSTDGEGFIRGLARSGIKPDDFDVVVLLGSGGAAQAVLSAIAIATIERPLVTVIHRRSNHHDELIRKAVSVAPVQMITLRKMDPASVTDTLRQTKGLRRLLIQATSAPKMGDSLESYRSVIDEMTPEDFLVDLIYDRPSDLYFSAILSDRRCQDGLPMLIEQARLSQSLWWGQSASYDEMLIAIKQSGWRETLLNTSP
jgi:shikimate dehydrogenase